MFRINFPHPRAGGTLRPVSPLKTAPPRFAFVSMYPVYEYKYASRGASEGATRAHARPKIRLLRLGLLVFTDRFGAFFTHFTRFLPPLPICAALSPSITPRHCLFTPATASFPPCNASPAFPGRSFNSRLAALSLWRRPCLCALHFAALQTATVPPSSRHHTPALPAYRSDSLLDRSPRAQPVQSAIRCPRFSRAKNSIIVPAGIFWARSVRMIVSRLRDPSKIRKSA